MSNTYSTESHDESLNYLIETFGFDSAEVNKFYKYGKTNNAVDYAMSLGWKDEDEADKEDGHYLINGKRILYWQDGKWWTPLKTKSGLYSGHIQPLDKQPKIIKSMEKYKTFTY